MSLTTHLVLPAIDLEHRDIPSAVDLVSRRMASLALEAMPAGDETALHVLQAELAEIESPIWHLGVLFWVRGLVPSVDIVLAESDLVDLLWSGCTSRRGCGPSLDGRGEQSVGRRTAQGAGLLQQDAVAQGPRGRRRSQDWIRWRRRRWGLLCGRLSTGGGLAPERRGRS